MTRPAVQLTRRWPAAVEAELARRYELTGNAADAPLSQASLQDAVRRFDAVCPTVTDRIGADVLESATKTKILGNFGVGFEHIDLGAAKARGVMVTNTPGVLTDATADIALLLMLAAARRAGEGERLVRSGGWTGWTPTQLMGAQVTGKVLGLLGFGRIARAVARRAHHGFGMPILYNDPVRATAEAEAECSAEYRDTLEAVLEEADFVSLHCPGGSETYHLIGEAQLARMKPTAILVNTARGAVVDAKALAAALRGGTIAAAGLDVYEGEPQVPDALKALDNVVLLPHLGSATVEARVAMGMRVVENLDAFFAGREPPDRVA
jgi:lactate dehydrogenase-like 2-hydroxyacid dehydrogenase